MHECERLSTWALQSTPVKSYSLLVTRRLVIYDIMSKGCETNGQNLRDCNSMLGLAFFIFGVRVEQRFDHHKAAHFQFLHLDTPVVWCWFLGNGSFLLLPVVGSIIHGGPVSFLLPSLPLDVASVTNEWRCWWVLRCRLCSPGIPGDSPESGVCHLSPGCSDEGHVVGYTLRLSNQLHGAIALHGSSS